MVRARLILGVVAFLAAGDPAGAGDLAMPIKAAAPPSYDWTGVYFGGHFGYAAGFSNWTATQGGAANPSLSGSLDLFQGYDLFKGTGSY